MPGPPQAVILDFNGTLADDEPLLARIFVELAAGIGLELAEDDYFDALAGLSDREICCAILARAGREPSERAVATLIERRVAGYLAEARVRPPIDAHAVAFVEAVAARVPLALCSGAERPEIEAALAGAGIPERFRGLVCAADVQRGKPEPEGYLRALELLDGARAGEVLVFEDSQPGVDAALAAGMRCIAVRRDPRQRRPDGAEELVERLDRALALRVLNPPEAPGDG